MKRVWIFVGAGFLLLLLFAWWYSQREWLTDQLLAQIKLGMKRDQVEALLGKPEDGYKLGRRSVTLNMVSPPASLAAPDNPWLATYEVGGDFSRFEASDDESPWSGPLIWLGRERALVLFLNGSDGIRGIEVFPITKRGDGFFSWLSWKWDDWMQGK